MRIAGIIDNADDLVRLIEKYDAAIEEAGDAVTVSGKTLEDANMEQGPLLLKYARLHAEAKNVSRLLDARGDSVRVRLHKGIQKNSDRALSDRTIDKYVDGDQEMLDHLALLIELRSLEEKLAAVVEAVKTRGYALNNITRARIEGVHMAVL